jgi:hypothetical protein
MATLGLALIARLFASPHPPPSSDPGHLVRSMQLHAITTVSASEGRARDANRPCLPILRLPARPRRRRPGSSGWVRWSSSRTYSSDACSEPPCLYAEFFGSVIARFSRLAGPRLPARAGFPPCPDTDEQVAKDGPGDPEPGRHDGLSSRDNPRASADGFMSTSRFRASQGRSPPRSHSKALSPDQRPTANGPPDPPKFPSGLARRRASPLLR